MLEKFILPAFGCTRTRKLAQIQNTNVSKFDVLCLRKNWISFYKFLYQKNQDLKCKCDDGENVHPWDCCSLGSCNVFCCNCGGECRTNQTTISDDVNNFLESIYRRFKREDHLDPEIVNVSILVSKNLQISESGEARAKNKLSI